jgi:hypothetical protein
VRERPNAADFAAVLARRCAQPRPYSGEVVHQITGVSDESSPISRRKPVCIIFFIDDKHITRGSQKTKGKGKEKLDVDDIETVSVSQESDLSETYIAIAALKLTASFYGVGTHERIFLQNISLGETTISKVIKTIVVDGTVRAVKICRCLDNVTVAKLWRSKANTLKSLNYVKLNFLFI